MGKNIKANFIRKEKDIDVAFQYLEGSSFNCVGEDKDVKGNPLVRLSYDYDPDNEWKLPERIATIVAVNHSLYPKIMERIKQLESDGTREKRQARLDELMAYFEDDETPPCIEKGMDDE